MPLVPVAKRNEPRKPKKPKNKKKTKKNPYTFFANEFLESISLLLETCEISLLLNTRIINHKVRTELGPRVAGLENLIEGKKRDSVGKRGIEQIHFPISRHK
jgi:hypothetical protein